MLQLSLEECTHLERAALRSRRMTRMSLGTCPRLGSIAIDCETMAELVREGAAFAACHRPRTNCGAGFEGGGAGRSARSWLVPAPSLLPSYYVMRPTPTA